MLLEAPSQPNADDILVAAIAGSYDYILIDCPPALGLLTINALTAAEAVLIPLQCEYYALEGLTQLLATLNLVRDHLNPGLTVKGVILTMYDARTRLAEQVETEVRLLVDRRAWDREQCSPDQGHDDQAQQDEMGAALGHGAALG